MRKLIFAVLSHDNNLFAQCKAMRAGIAWHRVDMSNITNFIINKKPHAIFIHPRTVDAASLGKLVKHLREIDPLAPLYIALLLDRNVTKLSHIKLLSLADGFDTVRTLPLEALDMKFMIAISTSRFLRYEKIFEEKEFLRISLRRKEEKINTLLEEQLVLKAKIDIISEEKQSLELTYKKLERAAKRDMLSGLLNRASIFDRINLEVHRSKNSRQPLSGILLDIDHFKNINDTYGHLVGDDVIHELGERLLSCLRRGDYAGRYGGEEFFLVLCGARLEQAAATAERMRNAIAASPFVSGDHLLPVTASFGVTEFDPSEDAASWIGRTDQLMYQAKKTGRNRVCSIFDPNIK